MSKISEHMPAANKSASAWRIAPASSVPAVAPAMVGHGAIADRPVPFADSPSLVSNGASSHPNPYDPVPQPRRGGFRLAGCIFTLLVMAALCFGTVYLLWKFTGK